VSFLGLAISCVFFVVAGLRTCVHVSWELFAHQLSLNFWFVSKLDAAWPCACTHGACHVCAFVFALALWCVALQVPMLLEAEVLLLPPSLGGGSTPAAMTEAAGRGDVAAAAVEAMVAGAAAGADSAEPSSTGDSSTGDAGGADGGDDDAGGGAGLAQLNHLLDEAEGFFGAAAAGFAGIRGLAAAGSFGGKKMSGLPASKVFSSGAVILACDDVCAGRFLKSYSVPFFFFSAPCRSSSASRARFSLRALARCGRCGTGGLRSQAWWRPCVVAGCSDGPRKRTPPRSGPAR